MKKCLRSSGPKVLFAVMFITFAFAVQAKAQLVNEILNRVEAHRKALTTLRADVLMGKYNPSLEEWTNSKGKVILIAKSNNIKEGLFRVDWSEPKQEILAVVKGKYYAYTPSLKQAYVGEASAKKAEEKGGSVFSFLSMSKADLQTNYDAKLVGSETLSGGVVTAHVQFVPKKASKYKSADIWIDKDGMIHQVKTIPNSGDESYVRLTNLEQNVTINTAQFTINLPKDVKIINS
jgi:outer membrane lipoprotein-sorting protein